MAENDTVSPWTRFDRADAQRAEPDLVERLRADPSTRAVPVWEDRTPLTSDGVLRTLSPAQIDAEAEWGFLGRTADGAGVLVAALAEDPQTRGAGAAGWVGDPAGWHPLRMVGATLPATQSTVLITAVGLGRWLRDAPYCSACAARTVVTTAGWARHCPECGREHFPRTDPAVIVGVESADGERLLLGRNAGWGDRPMYSAFAGFVEVGESLESAIVREIEEESGVVVTDLRYRGSQAWPYPRSLMLGFHARAVDDAAARADGVEIVDVRWFDRAALRDAFAGRSDLQLPGAVSIAHHLIRDWLEQRPVGDG